MPCIGVLTPMKAKAPLIPEWTRGMNRARLTIYEVSAGEGASPEQCARRTLRKFGGGQACGKEPRSSQVDAGVCGVNLGCAHGEFGAGNFFKRGRGRFGLLPLFQDLDWRPVW